MSKSKVLTASSASSPSGRPLLDGETHYSTDFDHGWSYSSSEKAAIVDALPVRLDASGVEFLFFMIGAIDEAIKDTAAEIPSQKDLVDRCRAGLDACSVLIEGIHRRRGETEFALSICHAPEDELELAPLEAARQAYETELQVNERVLLNLIATAPPANARPAADAMMENAALAWEYHGLTVSADSAFTAFFEAVVKPKFRDRRIAEALKSDWSPNKLAAFLKKRNGPKRSRKFSTK